MSAQTSLHVATPLFEALGAARRPDARIWLKMECFQPVGSFKLRGIGLLSQRSVQVGKTTLVSSSGGNAGLAVAYSARQLGVSATVVVPSTTPSATRELLALHGAQVLVHGDVWDEADRLARELAAVATAAYIPPFDHPTLWEGHSTLVDEMAAGGFKPDAVVLAVGGGGLMCGVLEGMHRHGWQDVKLCAVETEGAESLHASMQRGELVTLSEITSIAKSLGARRVASEAFAWTQRHPVESVVVSDASALQACVRFASEHRVIVEPACGAALSLVYDTHPALAHAKRVVVIVCGGVSVAAVVAAMAAGPL